MLSPDLWLAQVSKAMLLPQNVRSWTEHMMVRLNHLLASFVYTLTTRFNDWITEPSAAILQRRFALFANYIIITIYCS